MGGDIEEHFTDKITCKGGPHFPFETVFPAEQFRVAHAPLDIPPRSAELHDPEQVIAELAGEPPAVVDGGELAGPHERDRRGEIG